MELQRLRLLLPSLAYSFKVLPYCWHPSPAQEQAKEGRPFDTQNIRGRTKYSPLAEFDSVQDLATLGSLVPLIYTLQQGEHGGVRVESQLIWSRMRNLPTHQELRALLLFSAGELDVDPDFDSFAFGDTKINGYMTAKLAIWFNRGVEAAKNKPFYGEESRRYSDGTKAVGTANWKPFSTGLGKRARRNVFCGTVTPSQQAAFGQYSPVRNGQGWKYEFKYPGKGDGDRDQRHIIFGTRRKHVAGYHCGRTQMTGSPESLVYRIIDAEADRCFQACRDNDDKPTTRVRSHFSGGRLLAISSVRKGQSDSEKIGGVEDGIQAIDQSKIDADAVLDPGELYLIGSDIYRCTSRSNGRGRPGTPYEPGISGDVVYQFSREQEFAKGYVSFDKIAVYGTEEIRDETHMPIQKVAIGAISTTRKVDFVEIGLKSTVFRQINGYLQRLSVHLRRHRQRLRQELTNLLPWNDAGLLRPHLPVPPRDQERHRAMAGLERRHALRCPRLYPTGAVQPDVHHAA